jgi:hypothetical protein
MFEAIKYRWELRKLEKECNRITEPYDKRRKGLSSQELEDLRFEIGSELSPVLEEINALKTRRFRQIANRLMVPLPESKDKELWEDLWKDLHYIGGRALTDKGFWELKKLIRQEKRERREGFVVWLAALTSIAGIIGTITGLIAVLTR